MPVHFSPSPLPQPLPAFPSGAKRPHLTALTEEDEDDENEDENVELNQAAGHVTPKIMNRAVSLMDFGENGPTCTDDATHDRYRVATPSSPSRLDRYRPNATQRTGSLPTVIAPAKNIIADDDDEDDTSTEMKEIQPGGFSRESSGNLRSKFDKIDSQDSVTSPTVNRLRLMGYGYVDGKLVPTSPRGTEETRIVRDVQQGEMIRDVSPSQLSPDPESVPEIEERSSSPVITNLYHRKEEGTSESIAPAPDAASLAVTQWPTIPPLTFPTLSQQQSLPSLSVSSFGVDAPPPTLEVENSMEFQIEPPTPSESRKGSTLSPFALPLKPGSSPFFAPLSPVSSQLLNFPLASSSRFRSFFSQNSSSAEPVSSRYLVFECEATHIRPVNITVTTDPAQPCIENILPLIDLSTFTVPANFETLQGRLSDVIAETGSTTIVFAMSDVVRNDPSPSAERLRQALRSLRLRSSMYVQFTDINVMRPKEKDRMESWLETILASVEEEQRELETAREKLREQVEVMSTPPSTAMSSAVGSVIKGEVERLTRERDEVLAKVKELEANARDDNDRLRAIELEKNLSETREALGALQMERSVVTAEFRQQCDALESELKISEASRKDFIKECSELKAVRTEKDELKKVVERKEVSH